MKIAQKIGKNRKLSGFTLVELIVVITILAILATVGFLALSGYTQDARDSAIKANVRSLQTAITSEAAVTNQSPRYYVVHDADYALSGAFAYVDSASVALTGWDVGQAPLDSNYTAGKPDFKKLKLNPEKFRISASGLPGGTFGVLARATGFGASGFGADSAEAAYDASSLMAAWADFVTTGANGKKRAVSYVQAAGISPASKIASVAGNFPSTGMPAGNVSGLLRAEPGSATNLTGALVDGSPANPNVSIPFVSTTTWDSTMTATNLTFQPGNLTFVENGSASAPVRSTVSHATWKWYWEIKGSLASQGDVWLGVVSSSASLWNPWNNIWGAHWRSEWQLYINNTWSSAASYSYEYMTTDTLSFALDADTGKYWIGKNCMWYGSGNPSAWTNVHATLPTSTNWKVSYSTEGRTWSNTITANFGSSPFACTVPTWFTAGF